MKGQLTFDLSQEDRTPDCVFLTDEGNQEAFALCERPETWAQPVLVLCGPVKSGKSILGQIAQSQGADLEEDLDRVLASFTTEALGQSTFEQDLFHRLNWVREKDGRLLLTCRKPPSFWPLSLPDLSSRLLAAPLTQLHDPSDLLARQLMFKLFSDRQVIVAAGVIPYLLARIERSHKAICQVVEHLDKSALRQQRKISLKMAREALAQHLFSDLRPEP